ncbi:alpha-mannosidase [Lactobacillus sp. ESL0263]|uniref:alpha-mannosidase n=1 Tax=Lactobacillus sp. ESL0263 TaxID=2069350 RepID=UPI000EFB3D43|nr:glycoside hydrolase family 38 C-terminal domain-containing protein [Lactobacillus sp. ESL0263]RMC49853.1 alpha-mannosidase [Lactobacillus sp. ESL0263]
MTTAYLVNHTHWDREWYFSIMDEQVLGEQLFTEVLDELEAHPTANFCLDGQVSIVDEYVAIHPEAKARIQRLVNEGRLFIGPWYTQTDALVPTAESIIRNLIIGIKDTEGNYGKPMMIGYLPDSFGFNAQMPTLLKQVGIDNMVFWRGINFKRQAGSTYFRWHGLGNKEIVALNFPFGYFTGQITPEAKQKLNEFVEQKYDPAIKFESEHDQNEDVLIPSGIDQMNIVKNINQTVEQINSISEYHTEISTYPEFVELIRHRSESLPEYQGELRLPTYARVHRSIGSVRSKLKRENFRLEQKLLKRVEPLCVIGHKVGVNIGNGLLTKAWKKLLKCQPHDSLGGSVSENVAKDIWQRYKEVDELVDGIENMVKKKIAQYLKLTSSQLLVFNTDPHEFDGYKEVDIVASTKKIKIKGMEDAEIVSSKYHPAREHILMQTPHGEDYTDEPSYYELRVRGKVQLPALGYKVFKVIDSNEKLPEITAGKFGSYGIISNGKQAIEFSDGEITLINDGTKIKNFVSLLDQPNDGDTYDFSPYKDFKEQELPFQSVGISKGKHDVMTLRGSASLPLDLVDYTDENPRYGKLSYSLDIWFNELGQVAVKLLVDNQINSHRLRVCFSPQINTDEVRAEIQAGYVTTKNEPIDSDWQKEFVEKPVNLYNFDKSLNLIDADKHFTFWGYGQKEYQYEDGSLKVTLMATTGELGKPNLKWRPGRASGDTTSQGHIMMATPSAQEKGQNKFVFAFKLDDGKFSEEENNQLTNKWLQPNISYQLQGLNVFINRLDNKIWATERTPKIPEQIELLNLPKEIVVSALYPSVTDSNSYILRLENLTNQVVILPDFIRDKGQVVNALEEPSDEQQISPYDLISIKLSI